jgi:hypothetical protein
MEEHIHRFFTSTLDRDKLSVIIEVSSTLGQETPRQVHPRTGHEGQEREYRYTLSLTSALDGGGWSTSVSGRFTPRQETRYPLFRRLGWTQGRSGRVRKISAPPGFDRRTVQPVESRYID